MIDTRPVWLYPELANRLETIAYDIDDEADKALLLQIAEQMYAAPADPTEAVLGVVTMAFGDMAIGRRHGVTEAVLAALGCPVTRTPETPTPEQAS